MWQTYWYKQSIGKPSRMQLLGSNREQKSLTTSRRCFVIFTGFQSARESSTSWRWQFISAYTDYLADNCLAITTIAGKRHLRSAHAKLLSVPRTTTTLGMRSFAVAGAVIWNSLPTALRTATLTPLTVCSTSEGPPVWLIDSASEDYLWRAL